MRAVQVATAAQPSGRRALFCDATLDRLLSLAHDGKLRQPFRGHVQLLLNDHDVYEPAKDRAQTQSLRGREDPVGLDLHQFCELTSKVKVVRSRGFRVQVDYATMHYISLPSGLH